ncbi:hypothetical protein WNZ14_22985 [Hoeflea sp. AS60]|uniref:hypothetical protein n=1 Tax=Hoeflea sp. AS60 TaxID=3135780 RepID=UPI00317B365C
MSRPQKPLSKAIDIAASSKALVRHVQGMEPFDTKAPLEEFCGSSLFKAQNSISPMLLALSMELAMKAWVVYDGTKNDVPREHDLSKLFSYTSLATQECLKARYDREIAPRHPSFIYLDDGLERTLENARNAFVQWRYVHELERAHFDVSVFIETIEMILSEFESRIVVVKHAPPLSRY